VPDPPRILALLLDIEGTTTPVEFVTRVLFPYARQRLPSFLARHEQEPALREDLLRLRAEHSEDEREGRSPPPWRNGSPAAERDSATAYLHWLMDRDRKSTAVKSLQGRIWEEGYRAGELRGQVYPDVPRAFARWRRQGRDLAIFSSGSVLAQKLLFSCSEAGDLTPFIRAYFDTTSGAKGDPDSYRKIAASLGQPPGNVLFLSDVVAELTGAEAAGLHATLCVREPRVRPEATHPVVRSFDEVLP